MPLARFSLYESGVEIYIASTADDGDAWQATLVHIARESRAFVVARATSSARARTRTTSRSATSSPACDVLGRGGSAILAPDGSLPRRPALRRGGDPLRRPRPASGCYEERQRFDPPATTTGPTCSQLTRDAVWSRYQRSQCTNVSSGARTAGLNSVPTV